MAPEKLEAILDKIDKICGLETPEEREKRREHAERNARRREVLKQAS